MFVSTPQGHCQKPGREILCVHVDHTFCGGSSPLLSKAPSKLRHRFPLRKWQVGEGMFCGSK